MAPLWTVGLLFAVYVVPLRAVTYCYTSIYQFSGRYCDYGCCSYDCCVAPDPDVNINLSVMQKGWVIGLIVTGSVVVFIGIVVSLICFCIKSHGRAGRVVSIQPQPQPQSGVTVISSGQQQSSYGNQGYVYNSGNPGYTQAWSNPPGQSAPPPPPAYSNPAYPPGQSNDPFAAAASSKH